MVAIPLYLDDLVYFCRLFMTKAIFINPLFDYLHTMIHLSLTYRFHSYSRYILIHVRKFRMQKNQPSVIRRKPHQRHH
jgi:hypothetical protein